MHRRRKSECGVNIGLLSRADHVSTYNKDPFAGLYGIADSIWFAAVNARTQSWNRTAPNSQSRRWTCARVRNGTPASLHRHCIWTTRHSVASCVNLFVECARYWSCSHADIFVSVEESAIGVHLLLLSTGFLLSRLSICSLLSLAF